MCIPTIAASATEADVQSRLRPLGYEPETLLARRVRKWLHKLYPGPNWANGLEPDLLGEYLLTRRVPSGLAAHIALHGSVVEASSMLRVLGRILSEWPASDINGTLNELVETLPVALPGWLTSERDGDVIASDALAAAGELIGLLPQDITLPHIEVPGRLGPAGRQMAVAATRKWRDSASEADYWVVGIQLVGRLLNAGGLDEATEIIEQLRVQSAAADMTVELYLQLLGLESRALRMSQKDPVGPLEEARSILAGLSDDARDSLCAIEGSIQQHYADIAIGAGRVHDAFGPLDEAVARRRLAVTKFGLAHTPALAASLRARSLNHHRDDAADMAAIDITEAIEVLQGFVVGQTSVFERDLARCYDVAARVLAEHDSEAATNFTHESLAARTRLAEVFGVDAKIDLLASMVRALATGAPKAPPLEDAFDLVIELAAHQQLSPAQLKLLKDLHQRLMRSTEDPEWTARLISAGAEVVGRSDADSAAMKAHLARADALARQGDSAGAMSAYRSAADLGDWTAGRRIVRLPLILKHLARNSPGDDLEAVDGLVVAECQLLTESHHALEMKPRAVLVSLAFMIGWLDVAGPFDVAVRRGRDRWTAFAKELVESGTVRSDLAPRIRSSNERKGRDARINLHLRQRVVRHRASAEERDRRRRHESARTNQTRPLAQDERLLALRDELRRQEAADD